MSAFPLSSVHQPVGRKPASSGKKPTPASRPRPSPKPNRVEEILEKLRSAILTGELAPGAALAEPTLAAQFGVSRIPIREALIELEREGLVQFQKTGRTRVRPISERDLREIFQARAALEGMAARLACLSWTPQDTEVLEQSIAQQEQAETLAGLSRLDIAWHEHVLRRSGNERLFQLWRSVRWQFEMYLAQIHRTQAVLAYEPRDITVRAHRALLAALASGDADWAERTMRAHVESALQWSEVPGAEQQSAKG